MLLVGSGAHGFEDDLSDLDIVLVIDDNTSATIISHDWKEMICENYTVFSYESCNVGIESVLNNFFLDNLLEINLNTTCFKSLYARTENWKIIFDQSKKLEDVMIGSWNDQNINYKTSLLSQYDSVVNECFHFIYYVYSSLMRKKYWQAYNGMEDIRNTIISLYSKRRKLKIGANKGLHKAESVFSDSLEETLISDLNYEEIKKSYEKLIEMLWDELKEYEIILEKNHSQILIEKTEMVLQKL